MPFVPRNTQSRLGVYSALLIFASLSPLIPWVATVAIAPPLINALVGVLGGLVANESGDLVKLLEKRDSNNHDLAKASGEAVSLVLQSLAAVEGIDPNNKKLLSHLAKTAETQWLEISQKQATQEGVIEIADEDLVRLFAQTPQEFTQARALTPEIWRNWVEALAEVAKTDLPERWYLIIARKLHTTFPQALREVLKQDAANGGKAYAGMSLSLLGEIAGLSRQQVSQEPTASPELLAHLEAIVKATHQASTEQFCALMRQVESGFLEAIERAKIEIIDEIRELGEALQERLDKIDSDLVEIKENLDRNKPKFGALIGGSFAGVCANWQGRETEIRQLKDWIRDPQVTLIGIEGIGGLGKTSLAEKVFQELLEEYYPYWADVSAGALFTTIARQILEYFECQVPQQETEYVGALIACLQSHRCLLVLDNLETLLQDGEFASGLFYDEFFRSWTNRKSQSAIVVTTRERPKIRGFNHWIALSGFSETEGAAFLQAKGIQDSEAELQAFSGLVTGYPLLLRLVADLLIDDSPQSPRLERLKDLGLGDLQQLLTHPEVRGNHRQAEVGIVAVLDSSYQRLSQELKTLLAGVSVLQGEFEAELALAVSGLSQTVAEVQQSLRQLSRRSWLQESAENGTLRYSFQQVILAYIQHKVGNLTEAHEQAIIYYQTRCKPQTEWQNLEDVTEYQEIFYHLYELKQYSEAFSTIREIDDFLSLRGYNATRVELYRQLVETWKPEDEQEKWRLGASYTDLGNAYHSLGQYQQAIDFYQQWLAIAREIGDRRGEATSLQNLGSLYQLTGRIQEGYAASYQAQQILQELDLPLDAYPLPQWMKSIVKFAQRGKVQLALCFVAGILAFPFALVFIVGLILWRLILSPLRRRA